MNILMHTFMFADLTGFTEFTSTHGDERAADLAISFHERVEGLARTLCCEVVKTIGDAVMLRAEETSDAIRLGEQILMLSELDGFPPIRVGVATGPAVERRGDWFGSTVNAASRVAGAAMGGELLMTERARNAIEHEEGRSYRNCGQPTLKGLAPATVFACE